MKKKEEPLTKIWREYQKCKDYLDKKSLIKKTDENWNFYIGDQWSGVEAGGERLPVFNSLNQLSNTKLA